MTVERTHARKLSKSRSRVSLKDPSRGCGFTLADLLPLMMLGPGTYNNLFRGKVLSSTYAIVTKAFAVPASNLQEIVITLHLVRSYDTQSPGVVVERLALGLLVVSCYEGHKTNTLT
jgi:hypothetical protein